MAHVDAAVLGSGFGGLAAALTLAEQGASVALFERLNYPGGCASTFKRRGYKFESGATLFSGFGPGQLFSRWIDRHKMPVRFEADNPIVELMAPGLRLAMTDQRGDLLRQLLRQPGAPVRKLVAFFHEQERLADTLWQVMDDERLMPPFGARELLTHIRRSPRYAALLPWVGRPFGAFVRRHGLEDFAPLRIYLDALSQISLQLPASEAEAAIAFGVLDYYHRGTGHIHGGIGELAWAMVRAIERLGGQVFMTDAVKRVERTRTGWCVHSRRRELSASAVVANLLPGDLGGMLAPDVAQKAPKLQDLQKRVERGWGAAMLYLVLDADAVDRPESHHLELIADPNAPYTEGNHVFISVGGIGEGDRAPDGKRTATVSTHLEIGDMFSRSKQEQAARVSVVQERMRETIRMHLPRLLDGGAELEMTASPRTFERFTSRTHGYVGGVPRTPGLHNYDGLLPRAVLPGLYLVGDSVFPGPSTLATALGGVKVAELAMRQLA